MPADEGRLQDPRVAWISRCARLDHAGRNLGIKVGHHRRLLDSGQQNVAYVLADNFQILLSGRGLLAGEYDQHACESIEECACEHTGE